MVSCKLRSLRLALYIRVPNNSYVIIHLQRFTKHLQGFDQQVVSNIALLLYRTVLHMSYISGYVRTSERGREKSSTPVEWAQTETSSSTCLCSVIPSNIISSIHTGKPRQVSQHSSYTCRVQSYTSPGPRVSVVVLLHVLLFYVFSQYLT